MEESKRASTELCRHGFTACAGIGCFETLDYCKHGVRQGIDCEDCAYARREGY